MFLPFAISCIALCAASDTPTRPKVMIVGAYHMDNPNRDLVKTSYQDVLSERRQLEIDELCTRLAEFRPTRVAVEVEPSAMPPIDREYQLYDRSRELPKKRNEVYQLGFRIAHAAGLPRLHGIDFQLGLAMQAVIDHAQHTGKGALLDQQLELGRREAEVVARIEREGTIGDMIRHMNLPAQDEAHGAYLVMATVGEGDNYIGADMAADWYRRNLRMFANIARLADTPNERILVIVGAGHGPLLRQFVRQMPLLELVDVLPYLE